jgi:hypothetical protein
MATRNDITGNVIKSQPQGQLYRQGWDNIFAKKTADEWLKEMYNDEVAIIDPDGWRQDNTSLDTPITKKDFNYRLSLSTINM